MSYVLANAHWFALLIGALIFFHELGHFLLAKAFDVEVVRFSLGFGPRILRFSFGETEYVLSLLPLGGYVKMVGENPEEEGEAKDNTRALANKPLWQRTLIVLAGPSANLLLAFVIYIFMFGGTHNFGDTRLGIVSPNEPGWRAGLRPGDKIVSVGGRAVTRWDELREAFGSHPHAQVPLVYERDGKQIEAVVQLATRQEDDPFGQAQERGKAGVGVQYVEPIVGIVDATSPAAKAGVQTGDRIVSVGGNKTTAWHEVRARIGAIAAGQSIALGIERNGEALKLQLFADTYPDGLADTGIAAADGQGLHGYTGLVAKNVQVAQVEPDSPAARSGVKVGDRLLAVLIDRPGHPRERVEVGVWEVDLAAFGVEPDSHLTLELQRQNKRELTALDLSGHTGGDELKNANHIYALGAQNDGETLGTYNYDRFVYPGEAMYEAAKQVAEDTTLIGRGVAKMVRGDIPLANMGGPIMLFVIAEKSAKRGWVPYFRAMAMTSVNLGVLNILPIPVLDGGHLLFFASEALLKRPPSQKLRERATMVGMALLLMLMLVVFRNDALRFIFGRS